MDIQLVLEVSAIATVISAIISYLTFRRSSNLTYVTHERKEWREAIRKIAEDLEKTPYENRDNVLVKLKTRINAYGYDGKDEVKDAHIWKLIERMEKCEEAEDYIPLKKRMAFYLSALLKYDWERSKKEVYGNVLQFIGRIFAVVAFALFFIALVQQYKENLFEVLPDILIVLFLLIWAVIVVSLCWKWIELSKELNTSKAYIKFGICSAILLGAFAKIAFTIQENNENKYILAFLIAFLLFIGVQLLVELQKMQENIYYREFIRKYSINACRQMSRSIEEKKIMKIWIMNHYATQMFRDKAGRHYWFAKKLEEQGNEVTVFCATTFLNGDDEIDTKGKHWIQKYDGQTKFVFVKTPKSKGNGIDRIKNMVMFYARLIPTGKKLSKLEEKPDVIIASSVHPLTMVAGLQIAKKLRVPCICEVRDLWPEAIFMFGKAKENSILGKILVTGEHWIYKKADALIFTKEGDTDYLKEKGWTTEQGGDVDLKKCHYINNGIDLEGFDHRITENRFTDEDLDDTTKFNVIYAGTIRPVNDVGKILDCANIIAKRGFTNIRFLIYGEGVELPKLQERVEKEQIKNVKLKGFVDRKKIPYILSRSSINLLNYSQKQYNWSRGNSSNKLFEYMASGKPVLSTVRMNYSIIQKYNCGSELEEDTPAALAEEIIRYYEMPKEKYDEIGRNARNGAKEFDFNVLTEKLMSVIDEVMQ